MKIIIYALEAVYIKPNGKVHTFHVRRCSYEPG